jgi:hypothetical protein
VRECAFMDWAPWLNFAFGGHSPGGSIRQVGMKDGALRTIRMNCANCGGRYSAYSITNASWCKRDAVFLCQKCLGEGRTCPSCGSRISQLHGMLFFQGVVFLLIFGVVAALTLPGNLASASLNTMPVTSVAQLAVGASEKVFGTVGPNQSTVIAVWDYKDQFGNTITGRHVKNFWLNDSTGRVLIEMGSNYSSTPTISRGGESYSAPGATNGFQYESGDPISVIGVVMAVSNGTAIQASAVAPTPTSFSHHSAFFDELFFGVPLSISSGLVVTGVALTQYHLRRHERNLPLWTVKRPKELSSRPSTDDIRWINNPYPNTIRRTSIAVNAVSVALVAIFYVVVVSPIVFPDSVYFAVLISVPVSMIFTLVTGLAFWTMARKGLARLGTSPAGVYLEYRHRPKNAREFLAWSDIRELEAPMPMNRHAVRFDTPVGRELVQSLSPEVIAFLRKEFEAARVPYRDRSAPIRPSVESLLGTGAPLEVSETVWSRNPFRSRWIRRGVILLVLEVPALLLFIYLFPRIGVNRGDALFFFPLIIGAQQIYLGYAAVREVGISAVGFSLRERKGDRTVPWSELAELTPAPRGIRYKTQTGFAETVGGLDAGMVALIVDGLNQALGIPPTTAASIPSPPVEGWLENRVHRVARNLLLSMVAVPAAVMGGSAVWLYLQPANPFAIFGAVLPVIIAVFAIYPYVLWRGSPIRIAVTSDAIFVDYGKRRVSPGNFLYLPLVSIASAKTGTAPSQPAGQTPAGYLGIASAPIAIRTVGRINLGIGPVAPVVAQAIAARLRPEQLREWKLPR